MAMLRWHCASASTVKFNGDCRLRLHVWLLWHFTPAGTAATASGPLVEAGREMQPEP